MVEPAVQGVAQRPVLAYSGFHRPAAGVEPCQPESTVAIYADYIES